MDVDCCTAPCCGGITVHTEVNVHCDSCARRRRTLGDVSKTGMHSNRTKLKECSKSRRCSLFLTIAALQKSFTTPLQCLFLALLCSATVQGQPTWRTRPQNADVKIGKNVTLQCAIDNRQDLGVLWSKYESDGRMTSLFINDNYWNAPSRYYVLRHTYGYNLVITDAERDDDTTYECNIQKTSLRAEATVVVLGEFSFVAN